MRTVGPTMHAIAPIPILLGIVGIIAGLLWLVAAGSVDESGREFRLFQVFDVWDISYQIGKKCIADPMSVLLAFGILAVSAGLIGVGIWML